MKRQFEALSDRERQVIGLAAIGFADKQISDELGVSVHTLRTYWDRIRRKVGGLSRPALVASYVAEQIAGTEVSFLESLRVNGWVMDAKTWLVRASDALNDRHGLSAGVPHHMKEYAKAIHPDDVEQYLEQVDRVRTGEIPTVHVVFRLVPEGGGDIVHTTIVGVRSNGGPEKVYGILTSFHDCRTRTE